MNIVELSKNDQLIDNLVVLLGKDSVITEKSEREFFSSDVYASGITCSAVISITGIEIIELSSVDWSIA